MSTNEWHWARLKKDVGIYDVALLSLLKSTPFTMPKSTLVRARVVNNFSLIAITISPQYENVVYQSVFNTNYSDLLEPLE